MERIWPNIEGCRINRLKTCNILETAICSCNI
nr:MAG TPA: hypothetical protein [Bacteriophage sp.]